MSYPQNGDRILAIDCMTLLHPMCTDLSGTRRPPLYTDFQLSRRNFEWRRSDTAERRRRMRRWLFDWQSPGRCTVHTACTSCCRLVNPRSETLPIHRPQTRPNHSLHTAAATRRKQLYSTCRQPQNNLTNTAIEKQKKTTIIKTAAKHIAQYISLAAA